VDTEFFQPSESPYDPDTISFVGRMNYYPNEECMVEFCAQTLPRLREQWPGLKLLIVGADPTPPVLRLARIPGVVVTGSVPDVRPFVQQSALMVAPLNIARGTQNKILEAMAMGVPVVASRVAAGGVDAIANDHLSVASDADQLTRGILAIVRDPKERRRLSVEGRARIIARHEWSQAMARLDAIIDEVVVRAKRNAHLPLHLNAVAR